MKIGKTLDKEVSSLDLYDVKAITAIIPCPDNLEYIQRGPIGYKFGSPLKQVIVKQTGRNWYEFEVRDKDKRWLNGGGEGISGEPNGDNGGAKGSGGDGAGTETGNAGSESSGGKR